MTTTPAFWISKHDAGTVLSVYGEGLRFPIPAVRRRAAGTPVGINPPGSPTGTFSTNAIGSDGGVLESTSATGRGPSIRSRPWHPLSC
jgi:hypothetical protein